MSVDDSVRNHRLEDRKRDEVRRRCGPNHAFAGYWEDLRAIRRKIVERRDELERLYELERAYVNIIADDEA